MYGLIRDVYNFVVCVLVCFFFQAEDGIRDLVRSRGLGDVYKRQILSLAWCGMMKGTSSSSMPASSQTRRMDCCMVVTCLLYTSDAADDLLCVDLGGRRIIKKKKHRIPH